MSNGPVSPAEERKVSPSPPWNRITKAITACVGIVLFAIIVWRFRALLPPLVVAFIIAYLLHPVTTWIDHKTPLHRKWSVAIVYLTLLIFFLSAGLYIGYTLYRQLSLLWAVLPSLVPALIERAELLLQQLSAYTVALGPYEWTPATIIETVDLEGLEEQLQTNVQEAIRQGGAMLANTALAMAETAAITLLVLVIAIYLTFDAPKHGSTIVKRAEELGYAQDAEYLLSETTRIWKSYLRGQFIIAIIVGTLVTVTLTLFGIQYALPLGILSAVLEFLPIIGPFIAGVAAVIVALFQGSTIWGLSPWLYALLIAAVMLVIQEFESNVLFPRIAGNVLDLHPVVVIVVVLMGSSLAGLLGAILAAPVAATGKLFGIYIWRKLLDHPPFDPPPMANSMNQNSNEMTAADLIISSGVPALLPGRAVHLVQEEHQAQKESEMAQAAAIYPLTFLPAFKDYPWGGRNLATLFGRELPDGIVAESWEVAAHPNGASIIANGALAGKSLADVHDLWGVKLAGSHNQAATEQGRFPLLIKLLDANEWLSVQVHPSDPYAREHEGDLGKTEMWVVLHAKEDAELILGFKAGIAAEKFANALQEGKADDWLHRLPVQAGDVIYVPAGSIHALGPGIVVAEIQQNSDTTYRIYDWGRDRPVHIDKALEVLDFSLIEPEVTPPILITDEQGSREVLASCPYFHTERLTLESGCEYKGKTDGSTFEIWGVLEGTAEIETEGENVRLAGIGWVLLPAALGTYRVHARAQSVLLRIITPVIQPS
jgi:mannose-6-phosphate isomerase